MNKLLAIVCLWLISFNALSETTLHEYINSRCNKGCVNTHAVLKATVKVSDKLNLNFKHLLAIISVESRFVVKAKNKGNVGLTQVLYKVHRNKFGAKKNVFDPNLNILVGGQILKECENRHSSLKSVLRCYNGNANPDYPNLVIKELNKIETLDF